MAQPQGVNTPTVASSGSPTMTNLTTWLYPVWLSYSNSTLFGGVLNLYRRAQPDHSLSHCHVPDVW
jgi:hypothetical protein